MSATPHEGDSGPVLHPPVEVLVAHGLELSRPDRDAWLEGLEREAPREAAEVRRRLESLSELGLDVLEPVLTGTPRQVGGYRLEGRVGAGGMGEVHTAIEEATGRRVALKWVRPELVGFDTARRRFEREVKAIAALRHPGIVSILTVGEEAGAPWYAMEWLGGASLEEILAVLRGRAPGNLGREDFLAALRTAAGRHPDPEPESNEAFPGATYGAVVAGIVARVADALEHAHGQGILHRDLKPSNIVLTPAGRVVLVDFGLAFAPEDDRLTRSGSWLGSLPYSSPEQIEGRRGAVGPASDVYGLGITLIELLTLRTPYLGGDEALVRRRVLTGHRESVRALNPAVPRSLAGIAEQAADLDPARRPPTARALAEDLERFRLGRPVQAKALPWWLRLGRRARRSPVTTAVLLFGVVFVAVSLAVAWRERSLRTQITRLSDGAVASRLLEESATFWPPHPDKLAPMEDWIGRARAVLERRTDHANTLQELRLTARANTPQERELDLSATETRVSTLVLELAGLARYVEAAERGAASEPLSPAETREVVEETRRWLTEDPEELLRLTRRRITQVRARMESDEQWQPDIGQLDDFQRVLEDEEPVLVDGRVFRFGSDGDRWRHGILVDLVDRLDELDERVVQVEEQLDHTRLLAHESSWTASGGARHGMRSRRLPSTEGSPSSPSSGYGHWAPTATQGSTSSCSSPAVSPRSAHRRSTILGPTPSVPAAAPSSSCCRGAPSRWATVKGRTTRRAGWACRCTRSSWTPS